jgi:DNA mismatch endonuclease (patch repair protein)
MADNLTKAQRRKNMQSIKSNKNKSTELRVMEIFRDFSITGWKINYQIYGKPDFVFLEHKLAVFVDGCFWHGCEQHCRVPEDNQEYWINKINHNIERDKFVTKQLEINGWTVIRLWEHELKEKDLNIRKLAHIKAIISL